VLKLLGIAALVAAGPAAAIDTPAPIAPVISVGQSATAAPAMAASVAVLTPAQAKAAKANEVVCKSNLETGSLVKQHKRIHSATTIGRDFVLRARAIRPLA
jgi:hypothetical protein